MDVLLIAFVVYLFLLWFFFLFYMFFGSSKMSFKKQNGKIVLKNPENNSFSVGIYFALIKTDIAIHN